MASLFSGALVDDEATEKARREARVGAQLLAEVARDIRKLGGFLGGR
jgi:hypothetical protein